MAYLVPTSPFRMLERLTSDLDRVLPASDAAFAPALDLVEREGKLLVRLDLPGMKKDDISVEVHRGILTISGIRSAVESRESDRSWHEERSFGAFRRQIRLPKGADEASVTANYTDGVLEVALDVGGWQRVMLLSKLAYDFGVELALVLLLVDERGAHAQVEGVVEVEGDEHQRDHHRVVDGAEHPGQHRGQDQRGDVAGEDAEVRPQEPPAGGRAERRLVGRRLLRCRLRALGRRSTHGAQAGSGFAALSAG